MRIKNKLILGICVLFAMILMLGVLAISSIYDLDRNSRNIYVANNNSLNYARNMLTALERMNSDPAALDIFVENFRLQERNITETDELQATRILKEHLKEYRKNSDQTSIAKMRMDLYHIMELNMISISHKSKIAESSAERSLLWISVLFIFCILVSIALLIYFPKYIVKPIKELIKGIQEVADQNYKKRLPAGLGVEFGGVAVSFNKMAERLEEFHDSSISDILSGKKYIEAIVNSITEPIIGLNEEMQIVFVNEEALNLLHLKKGDLLYRSATEVALKNDLLRRLVKELVSPNEKQEPLKIYADNKESYFQAKYIPIRIIEAGENEQKNIGNIILLNNITEFKERDSAKTTLISTISHELKTPISAILMSLKLLEDNRVGDLNEEQRQLSESIKDNSNRLLSITGELLNMTQVETGRLQLMPKITKPIELIEYAIKANKVQADKFGCQIEVEYPEKISKLFVDSEKIAWVITNLLSNAIRYTPQNGRIIIGAKQVGNIVEIYVQDFGKGIDPRYHQSIFDRYFRVPGTKVQGSGLGLSISKDFVEAHSGTLTVESELGKGSRFTLRFKV
ncbi:ATP-binding protein [Coprobacter sp.]